MKTIKSLIITGYGLNCEIETKAAWDYCGAKTELIHLNDLLNDKIKLNSFHILSFIGGFSFGDHLGSGTVFANKVKHGLKKELIEFINNGNLIIGICNGFQTMTRLGLLPGINNSYMKEQSVALAWNDSGVFRDDWIYLKCNPNSPCVFTKNIDVIELPIRHGEGKFCAEEHIIAEIEKQNLAALRYSDSKGNPTMDFPANPNGSMNSIAGICDPTGRLFGLMPHPEAFLSPYNHPLWTRKKANGTLPKEGDGVKLFKNAVKFLTKNT